MPDRQDAVEEVVGPLLDPRRGLGIEPDLRGPDLVRVLLVGQLVEEVVGDDVVGRVDRLGLLAHLDAEAVQAEHLGDQELGLDRHVRPHVLPAVQDPAQLDLQAAVEGVRRTG